MISPRSTYLSFFVLAAILAPSGHAQYTQQGNKLFGSGALSAAAAQGSAVAVSALGANTAAVGATGENAVWIFNRSEGVWSQQTKLTATGAVGSPSLGFSAALSADGNTLIAGGPMDNGSVGAAWVFVRAANGTWSQQGGKLTGNDSVGPSQQGYSVALSVDGNTALVGGALDAFGAGATWVYTRSANGTWTQQGAKLVGTGAAGGAWQGNGVALSADGNTALIGAPFDAAFLGASWVFNRAANGTWSQQGGKLVGSGAVGGAYEGQSVSISGDGNTALIGGPFDNAVTYGGAGVGAAWVFTRSANGTWTQQGGKLIANDFVGNPDQGQSVSLSVDGNTAVIGGPGDNAGAGAAWIFTRSGGVWSQQNGKLVGVGTAGTTSKQGQSVVISGVGTTILSGAPGDNGGMGAAWVFEQVSFFVPAPATATAGSSINVTVSLRDRFGDILQGYKGTAHFSSSDNNAVLPADTPLPTGTGTFPVILKTAGNQTITVSDAARPTITGTSASIAVSGVAPQPTHFTVSAPATAAAGAPFQFTVTALDAANATVVGYTGPVHFSSTDGTATLPAESSLTNGTGTFPATLRTSGVQTIKVADAATASLNGTSGSIAVANGLPMPVSVGPADGTATNQPTAFLFAFSDPRGTQDLGVVNVLVNNFLDGRNACYIAFDQPSGALYLVSDDGGSLITAPPAGSASNSQCTVSMGVTNIAAPINTLLLPLNITFKPGFGGNKVIYMAARDVAQNNSGWQALGVVQVPGAVRTTPTSVTGMSPADGTGFGPTAFNFAFSDTNGFADLGVENILINNALDGHQACYLAYSRGINILYLVNDNGDSLLPGQSLGAAGSISNSQCTVSWGAGAVNAGGNNLTLNLNLTFSATFGGQRIFYLAARDANAGSNTDWQAMGTRTVK